MWRFFNDFQVSVFRNAQVHGVMSCLPSLDHHLSESGREREREREEGGRKRDGGGGGGGRGGGERRGERIETDGMRETESTSAHAGTKGKEREWSETLLTFSRIHVMNKRMLTHAIFVNHIPFPTSTVWGRCALYTYMYKYIYIYMYSANARLPHTLVIVHTYPGERGWTAALEIFCWI